MASEESGKYLGKLLVAKTSQGDVKFVGRCVGYTDAPTVSLNLPNGQQDHWRADLCTVIEVEEAALEMLLPLIPSPRVNRELVVCDICGATLRPIDEFGNVINFRAYPGGECCHVTADGASSLISKSGPQ